MVGLSLLSKLSIKGHIINSLGFAGLWVSVTTAQLCLGATKAATDKV